MVNPMDLVGKHIVIAGASSGIGAETARHITRLGGRVSLIARRAEKLREVVEGLEGRRGSCYLLDFENTNEIASVIDRIFCEQGAFDGAVYSVGIGDTVPLRMAKPEKMGKMALVNYLGYIEFVRCVTLKKYRAANMSVVGISSAASRQGEKGKVGYCSTKAAIDGAMRALAHELAPAVRVNNVLPGWVRTEIYEEYLNSCGEELVQKEFEMLQYMGKPLETIDVANAVTFLLSDASRFITGVDMPVDGGRLS